MDVTLLSLSYGCNPAFLCSVLKKTVLCSFCHSSSLLRLVEDTHRSGLHSALSTVVCCRVFYALAALVSIVAFCWKGQVYMMLMRRRREEFVCTTTMDDYFSKHWLLHDEAERSLKLAYANILLGCLEDLPLVVPKTGPAHDSCCSVNAPLCLL